MAIRYKKELETRSGHSESRGRRRSSSSCSEPERAQRPLRSVRIPFGRRVHFPKNPERDGAFPQRRRRDEVRFLRREVGQDAVAHFADDGFDFELGALL